MMSFLLLCLGSSFLLGPGHSLEMKDGSIVVSGNIQYKKKLPNWTSKRSISTACVCFLQVMLLLQMLLVSFSGFSQAFYETEQR